MYICICDVLTRCEFNIPKLATKKKMSSIYIYNTHYLYIYIHNIHTYIHPYIERSSGKKHISTTAAMAEFKYEV